MRPQRQRGPPPRRGGTAGGRGHSGPGSTPPRRPPPIPTTTGPSSLWRGSSAALHRALLALYGAAIAEIDLNRHEEPIRGSAWWTWRRSFRWATHPWRPALAAAAERLAREVAERFALPVFLYEQAARRPGAASPGGYPARRLRGVGGENRRAGLGAGLRALAAPPQRRSHRDRRTLFSHRLQRGCSTPRTSRWRGPWRGACGSRAAAFPRCAPWASIWPAGTAPKSA